MSAEVENTTQLMLDFEKLSKIGRLNQNIIPVVVQNSRTKEVLILAYVNQQALDHSIKTGLATFWSTSRNELWIKGKTSGDELILDEIRVNCEQNSLLFLVTPKQKGVCHTQDEQGNARKTCYYRKLESGKLVFI